METTDTKMRKNIQWNRWHCWRESSYNTFWCLLGCSLGDFGTIFFFNLPILRHQFRLFSR